MKYAIVIEKTRTGFSAYAPDVPGCGTVGKTRRETVKNMRAALALYLEEKAKDGDRAPKATSSTEYVEVTPPKPWRMRREYDFSKGVRGGFAALREGRTSDADVANGRKRP